MSGVRPTRILREGWALPDEVSIDGDYDGDDVDWDDAPGVGGEDQWKQPVKAATTAAITIATDLNAGDSLDGVTLAAGDRVLVKDQGTASQNGIYIVGTTPVRAADMDEDNEVLGAVVSVLAGGTNAGTAWRVTNTAATIVDTDAIVWAAFGGGGASALDDLTDVNAPTPSDGDVLTWDSTPGEWVASPPGAGGDTVGQFIVGYDGGLSNLVATKDQDVIAPFTGTITGWTILADATGSAVVDVATDTYAGYPTFTSITAGLPPSLSGADKAASTTLTGWTTAVTAGDLLRFTLTSVSGLRRVLLVLDYTRP